MNEQTSNISADAKSVVHLHGRRKAWATAGLLAAMLAVLGCGRVGYERATVRDGSSDGAVLVKLSDAGKPPIDAARPVDTAPPASDAPPLPNDVPVSTPDAPASMVDTLSTPADTAAADAPSRPDASTSSADAPVAILDYCTAIPSLRAPPVMDGIPDLMMAFQRFDDRLWLSDVGKPLPAVDRGQFFVAWRPNGLYVFMRITDPNIINTVDDNQWCEDSVEIHFDSDGVYSNAPARDAVGARQVVIGAPRNGQFRNTVNLVGGPGSRTIRTSNVWVSPSADGYVVEAFLSDELIGNAITLTAGGYIGLDLQMNVANQSTLVTGCKEDGVFHQRRGGTGCGRPFCDVGAYCRPRLAP